MPSPYFHTQVRGARTTDRSASRKDAGVSAAASAAAAGWKGHSAGRRGGGRFVPLSDIIAAYERDLAAGRPAARDRHRGGVRVHVRPGAAGGRRHGPERPAGRPLPGAVRGGARRQHRPVPGGGGGTAAGRERARLQRARDPPRGGRASRRAAEGDPGPGRGAAAGVGPDQGPVAGRADHPGRPGQADLRGAARPDPGAGHRAAAAGGPGPLGRAAAAPGGGAGRDERALRLHRAGDGEFRGRHAAAGHGGAAGGRQEHRGGLQGVAGRVSGGGGIRRRGRARGQDGRARAAPAGARGPAGRQALPGRRCPRRRSS